MPVPFSDFQIEGTTAYVPTVRSAMVRQRLFAHTTMSIVADYDSALARRLDDGTPVSGRWGLLPKRAMNFYGYIHHTEPVVEPAVSDRKYTQQVKIVSLSASYALKDALMQVWRDRASSSIVREVLQRYRLSASVMDSGDVLPSLTCNGQTGWQLLVSLARNLGWMMYSHRTEVIFQPVLTDLDTMMSTAAIFVSNVRGRPLDTDVNIQTFKAVDGQLADSGGINAARTINGLDPRSLSEYSLSSSGSLDPLGLNTVAPTFQRYVTGSADTIDQAQAKLAVAQADNRWSIQAVAEVNGDPRVRPGMLGYFDGIPKRERGFWYITAVDHYIQGGIYTMRLELGRDSRFANEPRPVTNQRRVVRPRYDPFGKIRGAVPASVLVNNVWRAEYGAQRAVQGVA